MLRPLLSAVLLAYLFSFWPFASSAQASSPGELLRWGYYVPYDPASYASLRAHLAELDVVALHWASLDAEGALHLEEQAHVTALLRGYQGLVLTEVINRDFDQETAHRLLTEPVPRERALAALVDLADRWHGLVLDFEALAVSDREAYVSFTRELRARLGPSKTLAVAVPARTQDLRAGWAGGFDYAGLAQSADLIFLMAYAYRTASSTEPGPTGPLPWIEAVLRHALTQIPRDKLILGLPAYGYDWTLGEHGAEPPASSVVYDQAVDLARRFQVAPEYDWTSSGARLRYRDGDRAHEVWFEDARTLEQKLALATRLGLRGAGWWRLGGEDDGAWAALAALRTEGRYFPETGYAITSPRILDYFQRRGDVGFFGYPVSREFTLLGTRVQIFQRAVIQLGASGNAGLLNLLDPNLFPLRRINGSVLPASDWAVQRQAPDISDPDYAARVIGWIRQVVPDVWDGQAVGFRRAYFGSIDCARAFPGEPCQEALLPLIALELWGLPTSTPTRDPRNGNFIYQRFQRGVLHFDAVTQTTQGLLVADYFKSLLTGRDLPGDLAEDLRGSPFFRQYDPLAPLGLARPSQLPASDLRGAFREP